MIYTFPWNSAFMNRPADDDSSDSLNWFKTGYDVINDLKLAIREPMELDHEWRDADYGGLHKKATLHEQTSDPTAEDGSILLYSKRSSSSHVPELKVATTDGSYDTIIAGVPADYPVAVVRNSTAKGATAGPLSLDETVAITSSDFEKVEITYSSATAYTIKVKKAGCYLVSYRIDSSLGTSPTISVLKSDLSGAISIPSYYYYLTVHDGSWPSKAHLMFGAYLQAGQYLWFVTSSAISAQEGALSITRIL